MSFSKSNAFHSIAIISLILCVGLTFVSDCFCQDMFHYKDYDRYRYMPKLPRGNENPPPFPKDKTQVTGDQTVLVEAFKGIVFVDHKDKIGTTDFEFDGVSIQSESLTLLQSDKFYQLANGYIGKPVSIYNINSLVKDVILYYRNCDQPVVDVSVPQQDITDGIVQVLVTEARIGQIEIKDACYFDPVVLKNQLCIKEGQKIYESVLQEELRWLYRNPFRTVNLELEPGDEPGQTDVLFHIKDNLPWRTYAGYEDTGVRATGLERTIYGINWFNAFDRDDQFGYQYTASSDFSSLGAHSVFYSTALQNRDIFTVYGAYSDIKSSAAPPLLNKGRSWQLMLRNTRDLKQIGKYEHEFQSGFDYKRSNTNIDFGGIPVFGSEIAIVQMMAGYTGQYHDDQGSWKMGADAYYSPGNWGGHNNNAAFQVFRPNSSANYFYARGFGERRRNLGCDGCELVTRFTGQLAEGNLPFTEQLGFGGYNSVRGYDMYSVLGDSGYFINLELISAPSSWIWCDDEVRWLTFYDFGDSYNHTLAPGEDPSVDLQSAGVGLRYRAPSSIELRIDYGWQISEIAALPDPRSRIHVGFVASF